MIEITITTILNMQHNIYKNVIGIYIINIKNFN
jgi:hypothetical protein